MGPSYVLQLLWGPTLVHKMVPIYVRSNNCITLLCTTSQFITNLKPGLGAYWEICTSGLHGLYLSHHVSMHGTRYFTVRDWDTGTRHNLRILKTTSLPRTLCSKSTYYSRIMLNAFLYPLFPKLCRYNPPNPKNQPYRAPVLATIR